jgi:hypothetical protein
MRIAPPTSRRTGPLRSTTTGRAGLSTRCQLSSERASCPNGTPGRHRHNRRASPRSHRPRNRLRDQRRPRVCLFSSSSAQPGTSTTILESDFGYGRRKNNSAGPSSPPVGCCPFAPFEPTGRRRMFCPDWFSLARACRSGSSSRPRALSSARRPAPVIIKI